MITPLRHARHRSGLRPGLVGTLTACLGLVLGLITLTGPTAVAKQPSRVGITIETDHSAGQVAQSVLGSAYLWPFGGMGSFDSTTGHFYPKFVQQLQHTVYTGSLRFPGGITADNYHWLRAIGPQSKRTPNAFGPAQGPSQSEVGPDEFGHLLDATGAHGVLTVNFGTGTASEAGDFVAYLTGKVGTSRWADLRARNGHPRPYDVPYLEVGNEQNFGAYWRSGKPVTVGGPSGACQDVTTCLYIYGGSTSFTNQAVVRYADKTPAASDSSGTPGQVFYAAYPPVVPSGFTVNVGGQQWTRVASLSSAGPDSDVYVLDPDTGEITFGDGQHGAIPAKGAQVTISYVSGPHDGFLDYYRAIKAAEPNARICSSDPTVDFIRAMGSQLRYDCLEYHPYVSASAILPNDLPIDTYQKNIMAVPDNEADSVASLQAEITRYAGHTVPVALTEYGQFLSSNPTPSEYPYYHDSLDEALLNASQLANWIRLGIPVANRQLLTAEIPPPSGATAGLPGAAPYATTGAIGTPGPDTVVEATGDVFGMFRPLAGGTLLPLALTDNPTLTTVNGQAVPALSVIAVRKGDAVYVLGINRSTTDRLPARLSLAGYRAAGRATVTVLNGPSSLSYNTPTSPHTVGITSSRLPVRNQRLDTTFPAHSVSVIKLAGQPVAGRPDISLSSAPPEVAAGSTTTVTATLSNPTRTPITGSFALSTPDGWASSPAGSQRYHLRPGQRVSFHYVLSVPKQTSLGSYQVIGRATGRGTLLEAATTTVTVASTLDQAYDSTGISDNDDVSSANLDGAGNSYSEQALTAVGLAPGATVTHDGLTFAWPDTAAGKPDNVAANGQVVTTSGSGTTIGFLGAEDHGPVSGTGTVYYTDGSTSDFTLGLGRYFSPPGSGDHPIAKMPYYNSSGMDGRPYGQVTHDVYVYYASAPITPGKQVAAVGLPRIGGPAGTGPKMHIFSISVGNATG